MDLHYLTCAVLKNPTVVYQLAEKLQYSDRCCKVLYIFTSDGKARLLRIKSGLAFVIPG